MKPNDTGLVRIIKATKYSFQGLQAAWKYEAAFRQEFILATFLIVIAFLLPVELIERILLVVAVGGVLIVELLNSAVEAAIDRIGSEYHELSGRAKDLGSAAVFISLLIAGYVWVTIIFELIKK
ncbi:diacylglycerol kinase (ATP) [Pseudoalteromonas sp. MBR-15]|jgi:diacylglycerol kinase (ATP)